MVGEGGAQNIGHQTVFRPVAASEHIAGARRGHGHAMHGVFGGRKKRIAKGLHPQFRAGFAVAIGVLPAQVVIFVVTPRGFEVFVYLVRGDDDDGANAGRMAHGLKNLQRAQQIDRKCFERVGVRDAHERLGGEVEDNLLPGHGGLHGGGVADVREARIQSVSDPGLLKQARIGRRRQGEAGYARTHFAQPQAEPGAFEAGMAGDKHAAVFPEGGIHVTRFSRARGRCSKALRAGAGRAGCPSAARIRDG